MGKPMHRSSPVAAEVGFGNDEGCVDWLAFLPRLRMLIGMMVTIELPDEIAARAQAVAAARHSTLDALIAERLSDLPAETEEALPPELAHLEGKIERVPGGGWYALKKRGVGPITNEMINQWREELGV